jgi:hypothetical protein
VINAVPASQLVTARARATAAGVMFLPDESTTHTAMFRLDADLAHAIGQQRSGRSPGGLNRVETLAPNQR